MVMPNDSRIIKEIQAGSLNPLGICCDNFSIFKGA